MVGNRMRFISTAGKSGRPGTAAVEFAVVLPLLFILLFGLWEVGRIVEVQQVAWNAAREGARRVHGAGQPPGRR